jgi:enoyl-CoA hydratase
LDVEYAEYKDIIVSVESGICFATFNRPEKMNALSSNLKSELGRVFDLVERDQDIKGLILTGSGKAFVAGADLAEVDKIVAIPDINESNRLLENMKSEAQKLFQRAYTLPKPVIAAVNGYALGGGAELAMACDIRIASENAKFGLPEVKMGLTPGFGGTQRLARLVGIGAALDIILTGRKVHALEAKEIGLVVSVTTSEDLITVATEKMNSIIDGGPLAIKYCKMAINSGIEMSLQGGLDYELLLSGLAEQSSDAKEGVKAFNEKRKPEFKNR